MMMRIANGFNPILTHAFRLLGLIGLLAGCGMFGGCGASKGAASPGLNFTGEVVERAEGFSSRPDWADPNRLWSRQGDTIRVTGYVSIRGDQRKDVGYRAADSYARAELVRFLSVRVVAVLEDQLKTGKAPVLREKLEEISRSYVDSMTIAQRYYERRKLDDVERLHIFSRLDIDQASLGELLQRATADSSDLRTSTNELLPKLQERWEQFADVSVMNQGDALLPDGILPPQWAKGGDQSTDADFQFVCSGLGKDEKTARAVAQARCSEKLCRLFGVQISAQTKVVENLDGITAESTVSEQCADIRVIGRETRYQSAECGPQGCVQWLLQSYPKSAYEEEKQRLSKPTIIKQQVVIQEGDKFYRDPAACETSLRAYSAIRGWETSAYVQRKQHLTQAMKVCQGIDGRESGLFFTLNTLLTSAIPNFTVAPPSNEYDSSDRISIRQGFTLASTEWRQSLDTQRFLTDRISSVLNLVSAAILPLKLHDLREKGGSPEETDALFREVVKYPFTTAKSSPHHYYYIHVLALSFANSKRAPYSPRYRDYLIAQAESGKFTCSSKKQIPGEYILEYLAADGTIDEREWQIYLRMIRNGDDYGPDSCIDAVWDKRVNHGSLRQSRLDQTAQLIVSGEIHPKDTASSFQSFLRELTNDERLPTFLRYRTKILGKPKALENLAYDALRSAFRFDWDWQREKRAEGLQQCQAMPGRIGNLFAEVPEAKLKDTGLCLCLKLEGLPNETRRSITHLIVQYSEERCDWIRAEDWPGPYYNAPEPKYLSPQNDVRPFRGSPHFLEAEFKQCLERNLTIERETVETYVTATHQAGRFSDVRVNVTIVGELKKFSYKDNRRGLVKKTDVETIKRNLESCMTQAMTQFQVPSAWLKPEDVGPRRVWFQFWDGNNASQGYVQ